jgi:hypothetical protein
MFGPSPFPSQSTHLFFQYRIHHRFNPLPCAYSRASHQLRYELFAFDHDVRRDKIIASRGLEHTIPVAYCTLLTLRDLSALV